jgi:hypothetical protein
LEMDLADVMKIQTEINDGFLSSPTPKE